MTTDCDPTTQDQAAHFVMETKKSLNQHQFAVTTGTQWLYVLG